MGLGIESSNADAHLDNLSNVARIMREDLGVNGPSELLNHVMVEAQIRSHEQFTGRPL